MTTKPTITNEDREAVASWLKASGRTTYIIEAAEHFAAALREERERHGETKNLRDYCKECPNCGAVSDKGPFPPMDEDGCCLTCGADGLVEGLAAHAKEVEAECDSLRTRNAELERALIDLVNQARKCDPVDELGHHFTMNRAYHEAEKLLDRLAFTAHLVNEKEKK